MVWFAWKPFWTLLNLLHTISEQREQRAYPVRIWFMLSGCPGALESLQAVISSVRQWNEIQLPLTRGDSKNNLNCSWIVSFWWQAPETFHHTHTPHTYTLYPHTFSRWLFGQWGGRSRILLPKRRAEQLAASWIHEISISVVCIVCDTGQQWFWSAVVDYMIIFFWYSHTLLFFFLSFFLKVIYAYISLLISVVSVYGVAYETLFLFL